MLAQDAVQKYLQSDSRDVRRASGMSHMLLIANSYSNILKCYKICFDKIEVL